jgi:hypothetical protein
MAEIAAGAPSTALPRGPPPPLREGGWRVDRLIDDKNATDKSVTRASDFKDLGAILRARRRSICAPPSLPSRQVKLPAAFVKRRQVLSSPVEFCQASSRLSLTLAQAISNT